MSSTPSCRGALVAHEELATDDAHPERPRPLRDEHADAPEPDDAERLVVQLDALPPGTVPVAGVEVAVGLGDVARHREEQRHRVLGVGERDRVGRVHHHHAAAGRRLDVDVVDADPGAADDDELVARLEDLRGDAAWRCGR